MKCQLMQCQNHCMTVMIYHHLHDCRAVRHSAISVDIQGDYINSFKNLYCGLESCDARSNIENKGVKLSDFVRFVLDWVDKKLHTAKIDCV